MTPVLLKKRYVGEFDNGRTQWRGWLWDGAVVRWVGFEVGRLWGEPIVRCSEMLNLFVDCWKMQRRGLISIGYLVEKAGIPAVKIYLVLRGYVVGIFVVWGKVSDWLSVMYDKIWLVTYYIFTLCIISICSNSHKKFIIINISISGVLISCESCLSTEGG